MKKLFFIPSILMVAYACNKTSETCNDGIMNQDEIAVDCGGVCAPCPIEYSETGAYGDNVLYGNDTLNLSIGDFSFKASVPEES